MNFQTAKQARDKAYAVHNTRHRNTIVMLKDALDAALSLAISKGMTCASIFVSDDIDPELVAGLMAALRKLGYRVKLSSTEGAFGPAIVRAPQTKLTLFW